MFGKLFQTMYDGTLASNGPWQALVTFQQLIILADQEGNVDMTAQAIARRTSLPLEIIQHGIEELSKPDPYSRTPDEGGRRLVLLEDHRPWGWRIVNYAKYRDLRKAEDRREYLRLKQQESRQRRAAEDASTRVNKSSTKINTSTHTEADVEAEAEAEKTSATRKRAAPVPALTAEDLERRGISRATAEEFLALRRKKRAPLTPRAWDGIASEVEKAGWTPEQAISKCLARGWQGFEAEWVKNERPGGQGQHYNRQEALEASNRAIGERWLANQGEQDAAGR